MIRKFLCKIGWHKWEEDCDTYTEVIRTCKCCGKIQVWSPAMSFGCDSWWETIDNSDSLVKAEDAE